jgi:hypothetical protein
MHEFMLVYSLESLAAKKDRVLVKWVLLVMGEWVNGRLPQHISWHYTWRAAL